MSKMILRFAEVGLRVTDLKGMVAFYREVLGMEVVIAKPDYVFLSVGVSDSPLGQVDHPPMIVLFDRDVVVDAGRSTLDHIAFEIPAEQYERELSRFKSNGQVLRERSWPDSLYWHARSFFIHDPEMNVIEFISAWPQAAHL